jgi:hypothetical protein
MTQPLQPIGLTFKTADEVNSTIGVLMRRFVDVKNSITNSHTSLAGIDLKAPPYNMTPEQETTIKSAVNSLDSHLDSYDMTFVNQLTGAW